jgi:hypothetical protein
MFDESLSDFAIPVAAGQTSMLVCNAEVYSIGMWLQMLTSKATLKIAAITNNTLTLINRNDDGSIVSSNPTVGFIVNQGERFVVCDAPFDYNLSLEELNGTLDDATTLCLPTLGQALGDASAELVGWFSNNPSDPSSCVGIKRIPGAVWSAGKLYFPLSGTLPPYVSTARRIGIVLSSGEFAQMQSYAEHSNVGPGNTYSLAIAQGVETPIGPSRFPAFYSVPSQAARAHNSLSPADWPALLVPQAADFDHSLYDAQLNQFSFIHGDYYAMVRLEVALQAPTAGYVAMVISMQGQEKARLYANDSPNNVSVSFPILVSRSNHTVRLNLQVTGTAGTAKYNYSIFVDGVFL